MSKKIISAILVMAMVISMSATALLSSVGAAAETDYEADRTTLKTMLQEFVVEGPKLADETIDYLKTLGILTWDGDNSRYKELHNRNEFWKNYGGDSNYTYFFKGTGDDFAKNFVTEGAKKDIFANTNEAWLTTGGKYIDLAVANISTVIEYAASAWYFGKEANDANPDATFNAGRNAIVKKAISMINTVLGLLKAEVGANNDKPAAYEAEFNGQYYRGFATTSKAYNQSIGFNPYFFILEQQVTEDGNYYGKNYYEDNYYGSILGQYTVRWYTFAEAREIDKEGVFAFENAIRTMAIDNGAGVLFYDFINGAKKDFLDIVKSLFENLVGKVENSFVTEDVDTQIKAFLKLKLIVENVYDLYIKDVYNNIYTATSAELLNDVLYAKRLIEYITAESTNSRLIALALADFTTLTNDIIAGINAVAPRAEQLLTATEITNGTALVRKAEALLNNWSNWASNDDYKGTWNALNNAKNALKNMIPAAEGEKVIIVFNADSAKMKNIADKEIGNDKFSVEFAPNFFAYIKLSALLEDQIDAFIKRVNGVNGSLAAPDLEAKSDSDLVNAINKYAHLIGIVGPIVEISDYTADGKDNKTVNLVDTTAWTKYDADPDKGVYKADTNEATANFKATLKYMSYLFDGNFFDASYPLYTDGKNGYSNTASSTHKYLADWFDDNYIQVIDRVLDTTAINDATGITSIYENVLGYVDFNHMDPLGTLSQDVAIDSVYVLMQAIKEAAEYADHNDVDGTLKVDYWSSDVKFDAQGKFDWVNEKYVFTSGHAKAINAIVDAVKNLTKDLTIEMQTYAFAAIEVAKLFGWEAAADNSGYKEATVAEGTTDARECWQKSANYTKDAFKNVLKAANVLASYMSEIHAAKVSDVMTNGAGYKFATASKLLAAYEAFEDALKTYLFTEAGAAKYDQFIEAVYYYINTYLGADNNVWNQYDRLFEKLTAAQAAHNELNINNYFADAKACYEYFALTVAHVANCDVFFGNRYSNVGDTDGDNGIVTPFEKNLLNPLNGHIGTIDITGYTREWAEKYNTVRQIAAGVAAACVDTSKSDMPVWYAERVLAECNNIKAEAADYTTAKLVEYKAGLEALLIEADTLNVYNYVSNTDEAKAIWADFVEAYANAQYVALDGRCPFADVDAAVEALTAAMAELEKIEAPEGASTVDTLNAKIAAAEALLARADVVELAEEAELVLAINAAKKALQFNTSVLNSTDLDAQIKAIDDIMNAIVKEMYTGADLKKAAKVLELQVVVDLYTEASYRKFANALEAAYAMAEEDTATESAMMAAAANVEARFGDLKLAPVEEEPEVVEPEVSVVMTEAIEIYNNAANGYDKAVEGCTAESAAAYNAAINTLKADIEANADDAKLLESIIALNLAKAALTVDVPETCDC